MGKLKFFLLNFFSIIFISISLSAFNSDNALTASIILFIAFAMLLKSYYKLPLNIDKDILDKQKQLEVYTKELEDYEIGLYVPKYKFLTSIEYKNKLDKIRALQKALVSENKAVQGRTDWHVNGNKKLGKQMIKKTIKMMLKAFNGECDSIIYKVKYNNIDRIKLRIRKSYDAINELNSEIGLKISAEYLNLKFEELNLAYEYELKLEEEKEILREDREKEREEKALQKEIEKEKSKLDKEILHMSNMIEELKTKILTASDEDKLLYEEKLNELKENINVKEEQKNTLDFRKENIGAGYVYIISNIGAFGENVFKIGVTRRLDPMERITELSSASVPFKFDVHAIIFSYQAYELETSLHKTFEKNRVNLVNSRKEFFNISISDIENELNNYKDLTIEFVKEPEAKEYKETLKLKNLDMPNN